MAGRSRQPPDMPYSMDLGPFKVGLLPCRRSPTPCHRRAGAAARARAVRQLGRRRAGRPWHSRGPPGAVARGSGRGGRQAFRAEAVAALSVMLQQAFSALSQGAPCSACGRCRVGRGWALVRWPGRGLAPDARARRRQLGSAAARCSLPSHSLVTLHPSRSASGTNEGKWRMGAVWSRVERLGFEGRVSRA